MFKQFTARRRILCKMFLTMENLNAATKTVHTISSHDVQGYSANVGVEWSFNPEKTSW